MHVFDLDGTLIQGNCSFHFGRYLYHHRLFSRIKLLGCVFDYFSYLFLGLPLEVLHQRTMGRLFRGSSSKTIKKQVEDFLSSPFFPALYLPAMKVLKKAQKQQEIVYLLSSSPDFLVGEIAKKLGIRYWKGTEYRLDEKGCLVSIGTVLNGEEKKKAYLDFLKEHRLEREKGIIYSDSTADLPLFYLCERPVGVDPSKKLRALCIKNKWKIL